MNLPARINKLESKLPQPGKPPRLIPIVTSDEEEAEALKQLAAEGWDPDSEEIGFIRLRAVSPQPDHPRYSEPERSRL
jgi:hypothetical protein